MSRSGILAILTVVVLSVTVASRSLVSQQSSSRDAMKAEIRAVWDDYIRSFSARRADLIAERSYTVPSASLPGSGVTFFMTPADVKGRFESTIAALVAKNYERSDTRTANVCILNDGAAILSGTFVRYLKDGSVMSEIAGTYLFAKTAPGWRIMAQISHSADRVVKCGE
jgi:NTF2-like protein (DUF6841)